MGPGKKKPLAVGKALKSGKITPEAYANGTHSKHTAKMAKSIKKRTK